MNNTRIWIGVGVLAVAIAGAAWYFEPWKKEAEKPAAAAPKGPGGFGKGGPSGPTPVVALPAAAGNVDVIVNGLGTVTPLRTVTVRSRVEGELVRVLYEEGQLVKAGQLLAEIDPRPFQVQLLQAEGALAKDRALLENARVDLARYEALFKQDSIAKQQVDTQASLVRQYEAAIQMDMSQVENAKLQLSYSKISAPIGGRVGLRLVDPGNVVRGGDANGIVVITQLQPVSIVFSVPQDMLPQVMKKLSLGSKVGGSKLPVEAWDREQKVKLADGVLASVDNQVDPQTGTVKLKSSFSNQDAGLFPNQFVNVRMKLDTLQEIVTVPAAAVLRGAQGMFVYVVREDSTVQQRTVKLGPLDGTRQAILDGVRVGELVVTDGTDRLRPGAQVEVSGARPEFKGSPEKSFRKGRRKAE